MKLQSLLVNRSYSRWIQAAIDAAVLVVSLLLAFAIRYSGTFLPVLFYNNALRMVPIWLAVNLVIFSMYELYRSARMNWREVTAKLFAAHAISVVTMLSLSYLLREYNLPRPVMILAFAINLCSSLAWRRILWLVAQKSTQKSKVLVIDRTSEIDALISKFTSEQSARVEAVRLPSSDVDEQLMKTVEEMIKNPAVASVVIGAHVCPAAKSKIAVFAFAAGKVVQLIPDWYDILLTRTQLSQIGDTPALTITPPDHLDRVPFGKRLFDIVVSLVALLVLSPVMLITAIAIRLTSPGPAIFRQERVGLGGKRFTLYKFRTMVVDAERETGPVLASENDPRLTRVGKFIRATRLDELPQLVNVLKGDMSLVGPRPERPHFVQAFAQQIPNYEQRLRVPGGVTGLAQVLGKYSTSPEDKLRYDLLYANSSSALTDVRILLRTLETVFTRDKAS